MTIIFRWIIKLLIFFSISICLVAIFIYFLVAQSLPDYNRSIQSDYLSAEVEVVRDIHAVPHIFGKNDSDIFFALGYVHAQERLWQMLMLRRTAQGKLSEIFGNKSLGTDKLIRTLGLYKKEI